MESSYAEDVDYGRVVAIRKTGEDAGFMRITQSDFTIGRDLSCDIKIRLLTVSRVHAVLQVDKKTRRVTVTCRSPQGLLVNKETISLQRKVLLKNGDVIDIQGRRFRFENSTGVPSTGLVQDSRPQTIALSGSPLHIFPAEELQFQRPCASVTTISLSVTNALSDASIYINVETNAPDRYRISPATGSIPPGDTLNILVSLDIHEEPTENDVSMDNVSIKGIRVPTDWVDRGGEDLAGKLQDLLQRTQESRESSSKAQSDDLLERTLKCVFVDGATDVNVAGTSGTPSEAKAQTERKGTADGELLASKSIATGAEDPTPRRNERSRPRKTLSASSLPTLIKTGAARSVRPATKSTLQTSTSTDGSFWQQMDKVLTATNQSVKPPQSTGRANTPNSRRQGVAAGAKSVPAKEQRRVAAGVTAPRRASTLFGYAVHPSLKDLSLADSEPTLKSINNAMPNDCPAPPENRSCDDERKSASGSPSHTGVELEPADSDISLSPKANTSDSTPKCLPPTKQPGSLPIAVDAVQHATSPTAKALTQSPISNTETPSRKSPEDAPEDQPSTFVPISNPLIVIENQATEENLEDARREESDNVSLLNSNRSPDEHIPDSTGAQETYATDRIQENEEGDGDGHPSYSQDTDEHANQADEGSAAVTPPVNDLLTPGRSLGSKSKKGVTFGPPLSPEVFDETLPINSPVVRGRQVLLSREVGKRSILKSQELFRREAEDALRVASELSQSSESEPVLQDLGEHGNPRKTSNAEDAEEDKNSDSENVAVAFHSMPSVSEIVEDDGGDGKVQATSGTIVSTKKRDGENAELGVARIETEPFAGAADVGATIPESRRSSRRRKSTEKIEHDDLHERSEILAVEAQPPPSSPVESVEEPSDNKRRGRKRGSAKTAKQKAEHSGTEGSALDIITEQGAPSMPTDAIELPEPEKGARSPAVIFVTEEEQSSRAEIPVTDVTDGVESTTEDQTKIEKTGGLITDVDMSSRAETPATEDATVESAADMRAAPSTIDEIPKVKKRGRPPKVAKSTEIDVTEAPATEDATIESPKPVGASVVGEKVRGSKRGQPPKVVKDTEEDTSSGAVPDDATVKTADIIGTAGVGDNPQVRKRGRPPKVTKNTTENANSAPNDAAVEVSIEAVDASTIDEKTPVRKRGRPPKVAKNTTEDINSPAEAPASKVATTEVPKALSTSTLNEKSPVRKRGRPRKVATDMKEDTCTQADTPGTEDVTDPSVNSPQPHAETADEQSDIEGRGRRDSPQATTLGPQAAQEETDAAESSITDSVLSASVETRSEPPQPRKSRRGAARARKEEAVDVHSVDAELKDQARSAEAVVEQQGDAETKGEAKGNANTKKEQNMSVESENAVVQELEVKDAREQVMNRQPELGRRGRRRSTTKGKEDYSHADTGTTRVPVTDEQLTVPTSTETVAEDPEATGTKTANAKSKERAKEANFEPVVQIPSVEDSAEQPVDAQGIRKRRRGRAAAKAQKNRETSNDADLEHASIECEDLETTPAGPTDSQPAPKSKSRGRAAAKKSEEVKKEEVRKDDLEALSLESGESVPPSTMAEVVQQDAEIEEKVRGMRTSKARQPKQEAVEAEAVDGLQQDTVESVPSGSTTEVHQPVAVRRKRGRAASKAKTLLEESAAVENATPVDTHATDLTIAPVPPSTVPEADERPSDAGVKVRTRAGGKRTKAKEGRGDDKAIPNVDEAPEFVEAQAPSAPSEVTKKLRSRPAAKTKAAVEDVGEDLPNQDVGDVAAEEPTPIPKPANVEPERGRRGRRRAAAPENKAASEQEEDLKENQSTDTETQPEVEVKRKGRAATRARKAMEERTNENAPAEAEPIDQPSIEQTSRKGGLRRAIAKTRTDNKQITEADVLVAPVDDVPDGKRTTKGVTLRAKQQTRASTKENHDPKVDSGSNADSKPISIPTESFYGAAEGKKVTRATVARRKKAAK
ncbi:hypothetical protein SpCBS45565_g00821 [Spizellomyces sp. 'palustris']|nr:hypothetical protein SpCBS45565_g00821 [Spizellomyces sp. 'palustris']